MPAQDFLRRYLWAEIAVIGTAVAVVVLVLVLPGSAYPWIKAFHIIAVIAWMAGMLYLPRLFVYHCAAEKGSVQSETFKVMERRLLRAITNPAMIATWVLGLWLAWHGPDSRVGWFASGWLLAKLALVLALSGVHGLFASWVKAFGADQNRHSQRFYRVINEVPTVMMIVIVILVVLKPF
jgi:protoporphyrinogen IX oxidase